MNTPELEPTATEPSPEDAGESLAVAERTPLATMSAAEALEKLRRGETIEKARIVGLKLKGEFPNPVRLRGATLVQLVIDSAVFASEVAFEHCLLERPKFVRKSTYEKGLSLSASTLVKAELHGLTVRGVFRCDNVRSRGALLVDDSRFEGRVRFWEAHLQGWVDFRRCEFVDDADFRSLHAEQGFVLSHCRFRGQALFRGASVQKKWQADTSRFEGLLDLSKAKLHDFTYLEGIEQGEHQRFAFTNALAERILIRPEQLAGRLASEESGDYAQAMQEYGLLKRVFEALHRYEHEDWAFYRFKVNQRRAKVRSWRRPLTKLAEFADWLFLDHGCGYGTNPLRAVRGALAIIVAFALVYAWGVQSLYVENAPFGGDTAAPANRLMIGALTSVSAFTSGFGDIRGAAHGWMNFPLIVESLLGTLLWGLFIVAFSRKVIR